MVNIESVPFTLEDLDQKKLFDFNDVTYKLRLRKNFQEENLYSVEVFSEDDVFLYSSAVRYKYLFVNSNVPNLPFQILPVDPVEFDNPDQAQTEINDENLGETVLLCTDLS